MQYESFHQPKMYSFWGSLNVVISPFARPCLCYTQIYLHTEWKKKKWRLILAATEWHMKGLHHGPVGFLSMQRFNSIAICANTNALNAYTIFIRITEFRIAFFHFHFFCTFFFFLTQQMALSVLLAVLFANAKHTCSRHTQQSRYLRRNRIQT